jgi:GH35 family endo-1,4-beta-xylanase
MVPITFLFLVICAMGSAEAIYPMARNTGATQTLGAINREFFFGTVTANTSAQVLDPKYQKILSTEFAGVALMDGFIWSKTEPSQNEFNFSVGDDLVEFASRSHYGVMGHSLVQTSPSEYTLGESAD